MKFARFSSIAFLVFTYLFAPAFALQWICLFVLCVISASYAWSRIIFHTLEVKRRDVRIRTYRMQQAEIELTVTNRSFLPVHYLAILDSGGNLSTDGREKSVRCLGPFERILVAYAVQGDSRGEYPVGPLRIRYGDPAGFFPWKKTISDSETVVVYPNVYPLELLIAEGLPSGNIGTPNPIYEDTTRFRSLREYVPGDEIRRIQWKISARAGKLHSMEYLPSLYFPILVLLNLSSEDYPLKHRFQSTERAIEVAASLVFAGIGREQDVGLVASGTVGEGEFPVVPLRGGYAHAVTILEILARIRMSCTNADFSNVFFSSGIRVPPGSRIMYVGPRPNGEQLARLVQAKRGGVQLELYLLQHRDNSGDGELKGLRIFGIREHGDELIENR